MAGLEPVATAFGQDKFTTYLQLKNTDPFDRKVKEDGAAAFDELGAVPIYGWLSGLRHLCEVAVVASEVTIIVCEEAFVKI